VTLGRVRLRSNLADSGLDTNLSIMLVDAAAPYRRTIRRDTWPVLGGHTSLAGYIGERWSEVCGELRQLGVTRENHAGLTVSSVQTTIGRTNILSVGCGDVPPTAVVFPDACRGDRIVGFAPPLPASGSSADAGAIIVTSPKVKVSKPPTARPVKRAGR
jgi:hypothetical protein